MRLSSRLRATVIFTLALFALTTGAFAGSAHPYIGKWSNGRGETLEITRSTLRFLEDEAVGYRDITKVTDGNTFELHITDEGSVNGFSGKYLSVSCEGGQMKMTMFRTHADLFQDENLQGEVTWFKDKADE